MLSVVQAKARYAHQLVPASNMTYKIIKGTVMPKRATTANYFNRIKPRFCSKKYFSKNSSGLAALRLLMSAGRLIQSIEIK
jgi:hypothetical protein